MKKGRPSKFSAINQEQLKTLYLHGFTDQEVAKFFGINAVTIWNWSIKHPDFLKSIKEWKIVADTRVERSLYERACGYSHSTEEIFCFQGHVTRVQTVKQYPPDTMACMYWLNNRKRGEWTQKPTDSEDERMINQELTFDDIPTNGDGLTRFEKFLHK